MGDHISSLWQQAPAITRSLVVLPLVLHVAGFIWGAALDRALSLSLLGVKRGSVWTVLTAPLWDPPGSLLHTLVTLLLAFFVLNRVPALERANGSGRFLVWFIASSLAVNVMFLLLALALDTAWSGFGWRSIWPLVPCNGMMPLAVFALTAQCRAQPEMETQLFGLRIRNKYYPFVLVGLFGLMSGPAVLRDVAGLLLGCFHDEPLRLRRYLPGESTIVRWESNKACVFGWRLFDGHWVTVGESLGGSGLDGGAGGLPGARAGYTVIGRPQEAGPMRPTQQFRAFAGRGQRLGNG